MSLLIAVVICVAICFCLCVILCVLHCWRSRLDRADAQDETEIELARIAEEGDTAHTSTAEPRGALLSRSPLIR